MADIFISYKREDRDRVQPFALALENEGYSVWWDPELPIGRSYSSSIRVQLNEARAVIAVWTTLSVQSDWVQEEATQGKRRGVLFPVRLDAVDPPIGFAMVETADLSDWHADDRDHSEWSRLLEQLREKLQTVAATAAPNAVAVVTPPRAVRKGDGSRVRLVAAGSAIVLAIIVGGFVVQRGCRAVPIENIPASAGSIPAAGSAPAAAGSVSPQLREVPAPAVAAGKNPTIADARPLGLGVAEPGEILTTNDTRFYKIDSVLKLRDLAIVRLQNESTTLRPDVKVFNADRSMLIEANDTSPGASVQRTVTLEPGQPIYLQVLPYDSTGKYLISVTPQKAYDAYEANDDILTPAAIKTGMDVTAGILDDKDHDWYRVSGATKTIVTVTLENLSSTLRPDVKIYDANKSVIVEKYDSTPGANLNFEVDIKQPRDFYIEVVPYGSAGKYRLRID
jgi:hypothetical protein